MILVSLAHSNTHTGSHCKNTPAAIVQLQLIDDWRQRIRLTNPWLYVGIHCRAHSHHSILTRLFGSLTPLIRTFGSALDGNVALGGSFHVLGVAPFASLSHPAAETSATICILGVDLLVSQKGSLTKPNYFMQIHNYCVHLADILKIAAAFLSLFAWFVGFFFLLFLLLALGYSARRIFCKESGKEGTKWKRLLTANQSRSSCRRHTALHSLRLEGANRAGYEAARARRRTAIAVFSYLDCNMETTAKRGPFATRPGNLAENEASPGGCCCSKTTKRVGENQEQWNCKVGRSLG